MTIPTEVLTEICKQTTSSYKINV